MRARVAVAMCTIAGWLNPSQVVGLDYHQDGVHHLEVWCDGCRIVVNLDDYRRRR